MSVNRQETGTMAQLSIDLGQVLSATCDRHIVDLFKEVLVMFERLASEHDEALTKLAANLPPEYHPYLNLVDWYTEDKGDRIRKEVLRKGNDCRRRIGEEVAKYGVSQR